MGSGEPLADLYDQGGERMQVYKTEKPQDNEQFIEYSFDGGLVLNAYLPIFILNAEG